MKYFIFTLTFMISLNVGAQFKEKSYFSSGKIITEKDTINCFIEQFVNYNSKTINYKTNKDDDKTLKIKSSIINHLKISTDEYDRVITDKKSYLMKSIKKGNISLYNHTFFVRRATAPSAGSFNMIGSYDKEKKNYILLGKVKL